MSMDGQRRKRERTADNFMRSKNVRRVCLKGPERPNNIMNLKYEGAEMEVLTRANTNDEQPGISNTSVGFN